MLFMEVCYSHLAKYTKYFTVRKRYASVTNDACNLCTSHEADEINAYVRKVTDPGSPDPEPSLYS